MKPKSQCKPTACQKNLYKNCYTSKDQVENEANYTGPRGKRYHVMHFKCNNKEYNCLLTQLDCGSNSGPPNLNCNTSVSTNYYYQTSHHPGALSNRLPSNSTGTPGQQTQAFLPGYFALVVWVQLGSHFWVHLAQAFVECVAILLFKLHFPVNHFLSVRLLRLLNEGLEVNLVNHSTSTATVYEPGTEG